MAESSHPVLPLSQGKLSKCILLDDMPAWDSRFSSTLAQVASLHQDTRYLIKALKRSCRQRDRDLGPVAACPRVISMCLTRVVVLLAGRSITQNVSSSGRFCRNMLLGSIPSQSSERNSIFPAKSFQMGFLTVGHKR